MCRRRRRGGARRRRGTEEARSRITRKSEEAKHEVTESPAPPAPANASRFAAPEAATGGVGGFLAPRAPVEYHVTDNGSDEFNGRPHVERQADRLDFTSNIELPDNFDTFD
jgi:hypothetical protein